MLRNAAFIGTAAVIMLLASCNSNSGDIPFPDKELGTSQPVSVPLQFSETKKLKWDTAKQGTVIPVVKTLDLNALPSATFDSSGFKPFAKPPQVTHVDFNQLRDSAFSLNALPSKPLQFKTDVLVPPAIVKVSPPSVQKGNPLSIFDLGPRQGLPAVFITALLKDRHGLIWIGSRQGIFRYDGENILAYTRSPIPASTCGMLEDDKGRIWYIRADGLGMIDPEKGTSSFTPLISSRTNTVCQLVRDENGRIWFPNTTTGDVIIVDPETETFKRLNKATGLSDAGGAENIAKRADGTIWITTFSAGVSIINQQANKISYLNKNTGLAKDSLRSVYMDKNGQALISLVGGGLDVINFQKNTITHYNGQQGLTEAGARNIFIDNLGRVWLGKPLGVDVLDIENNRNRFISSSNGLSDNWVTACTADNNNRVWVATIGGLSIIDQHAETVNPFGTNQVISLMEDVVGNIWVATPLGIKLIDPRQNIIRTLDKAHGLGNDFVQSFVKFKQQMWVTTDGGLDMIDPVYKTIEHLGKKEGLLNDTVYVVLKDKSGRTWFTGPSNGIDLIDAAKKLILHIDVNGGLSDNNIGDAREDNDGQIWLAGNSHGISVVDFDKGTVQYLNNQPGLKDTCSKMMVIDKQGRMWIGTDKGIYIADKKKGMLTIITAKEGLPANKVLSLLEYNGSVLAGTTNGVSIITPPSGGTNESGDKWQVALLDKSEGLNREGTSSWSTDAVTNNGEYLWGDNGIAIIKNIKAGKDSVATFITGISLMNKPQFFNSNTSIGDKDSLWVGDSVFTKGQQPVNTGYANSKEITWNQVAAPYNLPQNLSVPYNKNYLQFHFAQAHLSRQQNTDYCYILEGIDKGWSTVTNNTYTENYLNLPAGKYTFKVSSKSSSGKWTAPAAFSFTITPPWYKTGWAYTLLALLTIALLRMYIVYRSRKLQRENKVLEEKVTLRTNQLQQSIENLKAAQAQLVQSEKMASLGELTAGIAHEIQNPLNFVNNFSEVSNELLDEMKTELLNGNKVEAIALANDVKQNLEKVIHHGKRADSIVKGMLQHSRNSNMQKEPTDINALADEYLRLSYHGLRAKDSSFNATLKTDLDENIHKINIIPQDVGRVLLNLINNAFYAVMEKKKQSINGYEPTVTVKTRKEKYTVEITVTDNGNGIPQKVLDKIFQPFFTTKPTGEGTGLGLSLSYDIIKAHGGEIKVETTEGKGTAFTIQLPM